ncbi:MAG: tail fiber domain-containing protein, partial [Candidatus Yanofskybacteria bacterium]|nr:tail fiber domain-containing protein [Candidatus Yanofskybacteria bacterium]
SLIAQLKYMNNQLAWASSSTDIWSLNSGNVGIGTTTPTTKLDIVGNASVSGDFELSGFAASNLTPRTTGVFSLGTSALQWSNLFATNASLSGNLESSIASVSQLYVGGAAVPTGSGTLNAIPKWTPSGSSLGDSTVTDDGTTVTVNTATTARATAVTGILAPNGFLNVVGTLPAVPGGSVAGSSFVFTSAGSSANDQRGLIVSLGSGYTGSSFTTALQAYNTAATTTAIAPGLINGTVAAFNVATNSSTGSTVGTYSTTGGSTGSGDHYGVFAIGGDGASPRYNVGGAFFGVGQSSGAAPTALVGVAAFLQPSTTLPTFTSAALLVDNSTFALPIATFRDNGTAVMTIADGGNVGIGTTAVDAKFEVLGTASVSGVTRVFNDINSYGSTNTITGPTSASTLTNGVTIMYDPVNDKGLIRSVKSGVSYEPLYFQANEFRWATGSGSPAERMVLEVGGNLGIGATPGTHKLEVGGTASISGILTLWNTLSVAGSGETITGPTSATNVSAALHSGFDSTNLKAFIRSVGGASYRPLYFQGNEFRWATGTSGLTERMVLDATGNVGIGTAAPDSLLEIVSGRASISYAAGAGDTTMRITNPGTGPTNSNVLIVSGGATDTATVGNNARIAIIQTTATNGNFAGISFFNSAGGRGAGVFARFNDHDAAPQADLVFSTANNTSETINMILTQAGNVGIGTGTTAEAKLEISGLASISHSTRALTVVTSTGDPLVALFRGSRSNAANFRDNTAVGIQQFDSTAGNYANLFFYSAGSQDAAAVGVHILDGDSTPIGDLYFATNNNTGASTIKSVLTAAGNMGIGDLTPEQMLTVGGTILASSSVDALYEGVIVSNQNAGTSATAYSEFRNGPSIADALIVGVRGSGYTDATPNSGDAGFVGTSTNISGGLILSTGADAPIRFFTSGTPAGERIRILGTGNVGIGTTSPEQKFDVAGNILASGSGNIDLTLNSVTNSDAQFTLRSVGASARLDILGSASQAFVSIASSGYVGIGTSAPTSLVHISKSGQSYASDLTAAVRIAASTGRVLQVGYDNTIDASYLTSAREGVGGRSLILNPPYAGGAGGNVGVNTVSVDAQFEVAGTSSISGKFDLWNSASVSGNFELIGLASISGTLRASFPTIAGTQNALCNDNGVISQNSTTTCLVSSLRFKHDIRDLDAGLDELMRLRPVSYKANGTDVERLGFVAEEVEQVEPRLVFYEDDGITVRGVEYQELTSLLARSVQELASKTFRMEELVGSRSFASSADLGTNWLHWDFQGLFASIIDAFRDLFGITFGSDGSIRAKQLCLDDVCVTKDQLLQLLNQQSTVSTPTPTPSVIDPSPSPSELPPSPSPLVSPDLSPTPSPSPSELPPSALPPTPSPSDIPLSPISST